MNTVDALRQSLDLLALRVTTSRSGYRGGKQPHVTDPSDPGAIEELAKSLDARLPKAVHDDAGCNDPLCSYRAEIDLGYYVIAPQVGSLIEKIELELELHDRDVEGVCCCDNQQVGESFTHHVATAVDYRLTATDGDA